MNCYSKWEEHASAVSGDLRERPWNNLHVSIRVKCKVYRATVICRNVSQHQTTNPDDHSNHNTNMDCLQSTGKETPRVHDETPSSHNEHLKERQDNQYRSVETSWSTISGGYANKDELEVARTC